MVVQNMRWRGHDCGIWGMEGPWLYNMGDGGKEN